MNNITIKLLDVVGAKAIEPQKGEEVKNIICKYIDNEQKVILDFDGVTSMLSLFLNPAIGDLYGKFSENKIKEYFSVKNVAPEYLETLKRVIDRAKTFYKDKAKMTEIIDKGLKND